MKPNTEREKICAELRDLEGLTCIAKTLGDPDLYISIFFTDFEQIAATIHRIKQIKEVVGVEPLMYLTKNWTIPIVSSTNIAGKKPELPSILKPFL